MRLRGETARDGPAAARAAALFAEVSMGHFAKHATAQNDRTTR
ncbi:hypothetical protein AB0K16_13960 [Nonomuraea jabiensis]|uniref:Uncharacterized protein n=1 Tax=Nonomuraea jabiensis TaxID=882448 RepID=A0A7W9GJK6_9ACTN|nr:hypothetical protein [Nonomuraea jabiensis]MBB5784998.1 hypothetical protein [Nonomuraea jabiensis]